MPKPRRFYKPEAIGESRARFLCITLKVGDIIIDDEFVNKSVYVRWPDGHEEIIKVDYALFPDGASYIYKPCFIFNLHGVDVFIDLSNMRAIKIPLLQPCL
jgi:hypothetical protein